MEASGKIYISIAQIGDCARAVEEPQTARSESPYSHVPAKMCLGRTVLRYNGLS